MPASLQHRVSTGHADPARKELRAANEGKKRQPAAHLVLATALAPTRQSPELRGSSTSEHIPWVLLSLKRTGRAQGHYSRIGLSQEREGRSCLLGDELLKSLSFPVSNLQSGWKCPWGSILPWCCLHGPEAEAALARAAGQAPGTAGACVLTAASPSLPGRPDHPPGWLAC